MNDDLLKSRLSTKVLPPVDLLIRTGGEKRLSNFMLWDLSYAELVFSDKHWPEFDTNDFLSAIDEYYNREVKPHIPDSWMDRSKDKIGYEINFTKYFYKFTPLRNLKDISEDLKSLDDEIKHLSMEMTGE